jgi:hypothetical protein
MLLYESADFTFEEYKAFQSGAVTPPKAGVKYGVPPTDSQPGGSIDPKAVDETIRSGDLPPQEPDVKYAAPATESRPGSLINIFMFVASNEIRAILKRSPSHHTFSFI